MIILAPFEVASVNTCASISCCMKGRSGVGAVPDGLSRAILPLLSRSGEVRIRCTDADWAYNFNEADIRTERQLRTGDANHC